MKKLILLAGWLFCSLGIYSQKVSNVNFDAVKKTLDATPGLYKQLLDRFVQADTTLTKDDYNTLYYGQCFQKNYDPYGNDDDNFDKFKKPYLAGEYKEALPFALPPTAHHRSF